MTIKKVNRKNVAIVLVEPKLPENIGAAARAMNNMDLSRLILVSPSNPDRERMSRMATSHSMDILDTMIISDDLRAALKPFRFIAGTTARVGSMRPALTTPHDLATELISVSQENEVAILFGPEDKGLTNEHLQFCHTIINIPTSEFSSLNLAQAVMVVCYEIYQARESNAEVKAPRLANSFELEGMYDHLKGVLTKIGFLNPQNPERWMWNVRRFLSRQPLRAVDIRVIRGICRQIDWYVNQMIKKSKGDSKNSD
jgi:tRNA/rRNA methyltransferase